MSENKLYTGSICYTEMMEMLRTGKYQTFKSDKTDKVYINVSIWINSETDKYGNDTSIQLQPKKEHKDEGLNRYIGNAKRFKIEPKEAPVETFIDEDPPF